jgi:two-component system, chemotaxis family, response regulator Rcp1
MDENSSPKVLLIEDNKADIILIKKAFQKNNYNFDLMVKLNGEEGIEYLKATAINNKEDLPHLILLDLNLPKKNGFEVLQEVKGDKILKQIPIIILTTSSAEEDISRSYDLYANCYIVKPVKFNEFTNIVKSLNEFWLSYAQLPKIKPN